MNLKNISIALTVLVFGVIAMLFMQKGNYVNQAKEHYDATTAKSFKGNSMVLELVNNAIDMNKATWAIACEGLQTAKSSQDMAKLEAKFFPATKGSMSITNKTRRFEASSSHEHRYPVSRRHHAGPLYGYHHVLSVLLRTPRRAPRHRDTLS